jgi:L-ascorbate metabolism protein UlaG (beta-lactamase superfamily)
MSVSPLRQLLRKRRGLALCWLGNLSWVLSHRGRLVAFDLDLDLPERLGPPRLTAHDLAPALDFLFITHEHGDHFNPTTGAILAHESRCRFIVPANCRAKALRIGVPRSRIRIARPQQPFDLPQMHVEPLRAIHGGRHGAVGRDANTDDCGYILTFGGQRFLQPGDSLLTEGHLALRDIDVMFVSPTMHNMHVAPAALLIETIRPRHIFPQHFGTYTQTPDNAFWTVGYPDELRTALSPAMRDRYHKLAQGKVFVVP